MVKYKPPNIFSDIESLKMIFEYLKNKNVWYSPGTELANYIISRETVTNNLLRKNAFETDFKSKKLLNKILYIKIKNIEYDKMLFQNQQEARVIKNGLLI